MNDRPGALADRSGALAELTESLGVVVDPDLLNQALTHRSYAYEHGGIPHNERLEFLGDSVLGIVVTETLFRTFPDLPEGHLAKLRAAVVNARALAGLAEALGIGDYLLLGRGEEATGGRQKASILADAMEAVIGAIYLHGGMEGVVGFIHRCVDPMIAASSAMGAGLDWKTSLQEAAASADMGVPEYLVEGVGPDHEKQFTAWVRVGGRILGEGTGRSKKVAEQQAAETAYLAITARSGPDELLAQVPPANSSGMDASLADPVGVD